MPKADCATSRPAIWLRGRRPSECRFLCQHPPRIRPGVARGWEMGTLNREMQEYVETKRNFRRMVASK